MCTDAGYRIAQFIARLTAHAVNGIMEQVKAWDDPWNIQADKVGAWLMNEEATVWDGVGPVEPVVGYLC